MRTRLDSGPACKHIVTTRAPSAPARRPGLVPPTNSGHSNAKSEGINRVIKLVARAPFGFRNATNQRLRTRCVTTRRACGRLRTRCREVKPFLPWSRAWSEVCEGVLRASRLADDASACPWGQLHAEAVQAGDVQHACELPAVPGPVGLGGEDGEHAVLAAGGR
ncbi:transposase [Streptomyces sp. NBC_00285]|uniref:transposase n=1 Tax=Streptomyces sp. NBC_00285 TaxID=2975700 RepID=UPI003FA7D782